jgi:uncharacterized protein (DUF305 family)
MSVVKVLAQIAMTVVFLVGRVGSVALASPAALPGLVALQAPSAAPIFQPGAPGQPSKPITAAQSLEIGQSAVNPLDVKFMQDMIEHHAQAVEMVELLETRTSRNSMRLLGKRISMSQSSEIEMMRGWLARRGESAPDPHAHHMQGMTMTGMLSPHQMEALAAAKGAEFDSLFLQGMIQHHRGALEMVNALTSAPDTAEDAALSDFLTNIVADQTAEIERMNEMLSGYITHERK